MADAPAVYAYASDPDVTRFFAFRTLTHVDEAKSFITRCTANAKADTAYTWLIVHPRVFLKSGFEETGIEQGELIHPQLGSAPRPVRCFQLALT